MATRTTDIDLETRVAAPAPTGVPRPAPSGSAPSSPSPAVTGPAGGGWLAPMLVVVLGMMMVTLDQSIVNVAIATIQRELGGSPDQVQGISTAYSLTLGVVTPVSGWLGERYGLNRVYTYALVAFAVGSALSGLAWSVNSLIVFRIVQAVGGGVLPVIALAMIYKLVPKERQGSAMGLFGVGVIVAPAIAPTLGGYLVEYVNWRLIFYINVPIGALAAIAAVTTLPRFPTRSDRRFDLAGFLTVTPGLFALLLAMSEGQAWGWTSYSILLLLAFAGVSLALFTVIELSVDQPMLDLRVFLYWTYTNSLVLMSLVVVALFAAVFYVPLFMQQAQGWGALDTGLTLLPPAIAMAFAMPLAGLLYERVGVRIPALIGLSLVAFGTFSLSRLGLETTRGQLILWMSIRELGMGLAMVPLMTAGMAVIPLDKVSGASALTTTVRMVAASFSIAALTSVLISQQAQQMADNGALVQAVPGGMGVLGLYGSLRSQVFASTLDDLFLIMTGLALVAALLALLLRPRPAR
jgi:EmrB/QacA subfamily drug resistance transporter